MRQIWLNLVILTTLFSCARVGVEDSTQTVQVQGESRHVIEIDVSVCDEMSTESKREKCIEQLLKLAELASKPCAEAP